MKHNEKPATNSQFANNQSTLATALNVSRQVISFWAKRPESPRKTAQGFDIGQWRSYLNANAQTGIAPDLRNLRAKKMALEIELLQLEKQEASGKLVSIDEFCRTAEAASAVLSSASVQILCEELPVKICGQDAIRCREILEAAQIAVLKAFESGLDNLAVRLHK